MGRILGLDYGIKRTGISATDPLQLIVNPLEVVETERLFEYLKKYLTEEDVDKIVIGKTTHRDGSEMYFEKDIEKLIKDINALFPDIVIDRQEEDFTSAEAQKLLVKMGIKKKKRQDKSLLDKVSAVLILQRYLNHI